MEERNFGRCGLRGSVVGLGCNNFGWSIDKEASRKVVDKAFDLGVTFFDTAHFYGAAPGDSEIVLGELLKGRRQEIVLGTKFGHPFTGPRKIDNSRRYILDALEGGLKRLQTDWIDIYMIHVSDPTTPMEEILRALDEIVKSGKARYIACCNLPAWRVVEAKWLARELNGHSFIAAQNEYSLLNRNVEKELLPALQEYGMGFIPYFPLASGLLTGKYLSGSASGRLQDNWLNLGKKFLTETNRTCVRKLDEYAKAHGRGMLELAMSWISQRPSVTSVIAGATTAEQLEQNVSAIGWKLNADELLEIDAIVA